MFAVTNPGRRGSAVFGGLLLAALFSGADLAAPKAASAQAIAGSTALLAHFEVGYARVESAAFRAAEETEAQSPSPEAALLGRIEVRHTGERSREASAERRSIGGEQALLGRRGESIS